MRRVASLCALILAVNVVACDDDETSRPDTVDTTADVVPDASPDTADAAPEVDDTVPELTDTAPDTTPDVADTEPDTTPDVADTAPDTAPDIAADTEPDIADTAPDTTPDVADVEPDTTPDVADVEPDASIEGTESQGWIVTAHTPELSGAGDTVTGSMTFTRFSGAETRGGGVCLVADLHDATPCVTREDCVAALPPFSEDYFLGGFYYCAKAAGDVASRCWTRPGSAPAYCTRGSNHQPGVITTPAVPAQVGGEATLWMSYACMADETNPAGCAGTEYVVDLSPTLLVSGDGTESQSWVVTAHTPQLSGAGDTVTGSMTFTRFNGAETRGGGVCLVADLHDATPCVTREDCVAALPPFSEDYFLGGYYYCAAAQGDVEKRCWTRPGAQPAYCGRNMSGLPGDFSTPAVPAQVGGEATLWMSYACMADETNPAGCAGTEYVVDLSPTLLVSP